MNFTRSDAPMRRCASCVRLLSSSLPTIFADEGRFNTAVSGQTIRPGLDRAAFAVRLSSLFNVFVCPGSLSCSPGLIHGWTAATRKYRDGKPVEGWNIPKTRTEKTAAAANTCCLHPPDLSSIDAIAALTRTIRKVTPYSPVIAEI